MEEDNEDGRDVINGFIMHNKDKEDGEDCQGMTTILLSEIPKLENILSMVDSFSVCTKVIFTMEMSSLTTLAPMWSMKDSTAANL